MYFVFFLYYRYSAWTHCSKEDFVCLMKLDNCVLQLSQVHPSSTKLYLLFTDSNE